MEFNVQVRNSQFSQFRVLNGLLTLGEASQRELANSLEVTPAVVTRQAEVLGSRGLVTQRANPRSKREKVLALTRKGEAAALDAAKVIAEGETRVRGLLRVQDEVAFERAIDLLMKALDRV
jgi:DNA-binding MarR family transcriptional regulator